MSGKVAIIVGASRGIGRQLALTYAAAGYNLTISAKTAHAKDSSLPGSLDEVAQASAAVDDMVSRTLDRYGRVDSVVYNPGAIFWDTLENTPLKKLDLMYGVNLRGAFVCAQAVLPTMRAQNAGSLIFVAPPIYSRFVRGKTAYATTKIGLSVMALGLAHDVKGTDIRVNSMWPTTVIESEVTSKMGAPPAVMRTAHVFADACLALSELTPADSPQGETLLDEDFLRTQGWNDEDFVKYRCAPGVEPPRMMPRNLPSLAVEEQEENIMSGSAAPSVSASAKDAGLTSGRHGDTPSAPKSRL